MSRPNLRVVIGESAGLHHAHVLVGARDVLKEALVTYFNDTLGVPFVGNPDVALFTFDVVGVDDGRMISEHARITPLGKRRFLVVEANSFTREAQNALLKTLEEPVAGVHFFFIMPNDGSLLPTIRSRVFIHLVESDATQDAMARIAEEFLSASIADRLKIVRDIATLVSDGERTKADVIRFAAHLERLVYEKIKTGKLAMADVVHFLEAIRLVKQYVLDVSSSVKMLLEHVAACHIGTYVK